MLAVIYAKVLHHNFIPNIYENFKPNSSFEEFLSDNSLISGHYFKNAKYHVL